MRRLLALVLPVLTLGVADCYSTGDGTAPPIKSFYYPVGLQVSHGGSVLYAVNSDFDLQYNGGTLQAYDLRKIRQDAVAIIADPRAPQVPVINRSTAPVNPCLGSAVPVIAADGETRERLGDTCAPPVDATSYVRSTAVIGAFATDLLLSDPPSALVGDAPPVNRGYDRLFMPVRGDGTITWANVARDSFDAVIPADPAAYAPYHFQCGQGGDGGRCDTSHQAGANSDEAGNTRHLTMPGEPFGITFSDDGESLVVTHQNDQLASLFSTGLFRGFDPGADSSPPALEFILGGMPFGGIGVASVPHDPDLQPRPNASFLWTSRLAGEVDLIRRYPDQVGQAPNAPIGSSLKRPFLDREAAYSVSASAGGADSRGIVIDPTPRLVCKARIAPANPATGRSDATVAAEKTRCAELPARVFIANRSPAALLVGDLGSKTSTGLYDPDRLIIHTSIPVSGGPSNLYLAPIVDKDGAYSLRVFVVCFDSASVFVYDPDGLTLENVIRTAPGPFVMTFDPFVLEDVAARKIVPMGADGIRQFRFGYVASFTESFVQMLDLDNAQTDTSTYERIVFQLGAPTQPKGS